MKGYLKAKPYGSTMTGIQKAIAMKKAEEMQHEIEEMKLKLMIKESLGYYKK